MMELTPVLIDQSACLTAIATVRSPGRPGRDGLAGPAPPSTVSPALAVPISALLADRLCLAVALPPSRCARYFCLRIRSEHPPASHSRSPGTLVLFCPGAAGVGELESLGQKLLIEWTCPEDISASIFANLPLALRFKPLPSQPYPLPSSVSRCSGFLGPGAGCRSSL